MSFRSRQTPPLPSAAILLAAAAIVAGLLVAFRPAPRTADLRIWTFATEQADALLARAPDGDPSALKEFEAASGRSVAVEVMTPRSLDLRLMTLLRGDGDARNLPDVVQLESLSAAKHLDAPAERIPLLPLEERLAADGLTGRLLPARLRSWTRHGHLYGIPLDVHPTTLTYRRDLFAEAGLDPSTCETWEELADLLRAYGEHWQRRGRPHRRGLELARTRSDHVTLMLQQRGIGLVDAGGRPNLDDERIVPVLRDYAEWLAGDRPIAAPTSEGHGRWARDFARGDVAMIWTPDWRIRLLEESAPELAGQLAMMPLPRFELTDARTAVWGGSMLAIPKGVEDADAAWELLKQLAFDRGAIAARRYETLVLPATREALRPGANVRTSRLFGDQPIWQLYARLAAEADPEPVTPLSIAAAGHLAAIVSRAADARATGTTGAGLDAALREWLTEAQRDLERRATFGAG